MLPLILSIIDSSLKLALEVVKDMPAEQKAAFWKRHEDRMEQWEKLLNRFPLGGPDA